MDYAGWITEDGRLPNGEMPSVIYMITCLVDGKRYIGRTACGVKTRMADHLYRQPRNKRNNSPLVQAVRRHGADMFRFSILMRCQTHEESGSHEERLIKSLSPEFNVRKITDAWAVHRTVKARTNKLPEDWCLEGEEWRDILGHEGSYQVSSFGRVRSLPRGAGKSPTAMGGRKPRILKQHMSRRYPSVGFRKKGKLYSHTVHTLVAAAFLGPRPQGLLVCHFDDVRGHNYVSNLYYGTHAQNTEDSIRNGRTPSGEKNGNSKLTPSTVRSMRALNGTLSISALSRRFGVCRHCVRSVLARRTWAHVE